jgi:hypothetical protein
MKDINCLCKAVEPFNISPIALLKISEIVHIKIIVKICVVRHYYWDVKLTGNTQTDQSNSKLDGYMYNIRVKFQYRIATVL